MATIYIQRLDSSNPPIPTITYTIDNIDNCTIDYDTPASLLSMPQSDDTQAVAVKITGNTSLFSVSWTIRDLTGQTSPVSGSDISVKNSQVKTMLQQLIFFDTLFQNTTIDQKFRLQINDNSTPFRKDGNLVRMTFTIVSVAPLTIQASITLQTGNVIAAYNNDVPQPPTGLIATSTIAGQVTLSWTDASDHGSQPITNHRIQYLSAGSQWVDAPTIGTPTVTTITGLTSSIPYIFRVSTVSSKGGSDWSTSSNWVVVI